MPRRGRTVRTLAEAEDLADEEEGKVISYTAVLITQGKHRFYTCTMPSDVLTATCTVDRRVEKPIHGFQRRLDKRRAQDIANYIDSGLGTIPGSIILSAQPEAKLGYDHSKRTLRFIRHPRAFLILDGQHRVFGFHLANSKLRVPVVIYNKLSKSEEVQLFMDINTKQRPVPNELILDIKHMAEKENNEDELLRSIFDLFEKNPESPLFGLMSPRERRTGKISRVTFNAALRNIFNTFEDSDGEYIYDVLGAYLHAWLSELRKREIENNITNPTMFRAIILLFPTVAVRVSDRYGADYTTQHFYDAMQPMYRRLKTADLRKTSSGPRVLHENFKKLLETSFSIGRGRSI